MARCFVVKDGLNYTSNVAPMFFSEEVFGKDGIRSIDRMAGFEAIPILLKALDGLRSDPHKFKEMNPNNGWGDYEGAVRLIENLIEWCRDERYAQFDIW